MRRLVPQALVALLCLLLTTACGVRREAAKPRAQKHVTPVRIRGATPEQHTLLRDILSGLGPKTSIRGVEVEPAANSGWGDKRPDAVLLDVATSPAHSARADFEAELVGEAFSERSYALGLQPVVALESNNDGGGNISVDAKHADEGGTGISGETLRSKIEDAARAAGVRVANLDVLRPHRPAAAVTLATDNPEAFLRTSGTRFLEAVPNPESAGYAGLYAEAVDADGHAFWGSWSTSTSAIDGAGASSEWVRPELEGCGFPTLGVGLMGPPRPPPPPCPTDAAEPRNHTRPSTRIVGATPAQEAVLREILAGVEEWRISTVEIVRNIDEEWGAPTDAVGVKVSAAKPDGYSTWQAMLVVDAFATQSKRLGLAPIGFVEWSPGDQSGSLDWPLRDEGSLSTDEAEKAIADVRAIAAKHGARTTARMIEPRRLAIAIEFSVDDPAAFLRDWLEPSLRPLTGEDKIDGLYVKVVDTDGEPVFELGAGLWVRHDLISCSPYPYFPSSDDELPPCPAD